MTILVAGHSHINCMEAAAKNTGSRLRFVQLRSDVFRPAVGVDEWAPSKVGTCDQQAIKDVLETESRYASLSVLSPTGSEHLFAAHWRVGLNTSYEDVARRLRIQMKNYTDWLATLSTVVRSPRVVVLPPPPPPIEIESFVLDSKLDLWKGLMSNGVAPKALRLHTWKTQCSIIGEIAARSGMQYVDLPAEAYSSGGFLNESFRGHDPLHANKAYGKLMLDHIEHLASDPDFSTRFGTRQQRAGSAAAEPASAPTDKRHPYVDLPDRAFWKQGVVDPPADEFDPVDSPPFTIAPTSAVATAGSCFAQHISKRIRANGFNFLVTESPVADRTGNSEQRGFYDFSARYGNVYTARQLLQLFDRAFGQFEPLEQAWKTTDGKYCDPFRPRIEPDGFATLEELRADRESHLAAVREMFTTLDVFVFTLGLTEAWMSRADGAVYPVAPGVAGGRFDSSEYRFVNFSYEQIIEDLRLFVRKLRKLNPAAKMIVTVSPVPLTATYEPVNVLVATTYSKSVLRVAAETLARTFSDVYYFPSFEIITGGYTRGRYFESDLRSVTTLGVDHVMKIFMRHLMAIDGDSSSTSDRPTAAPRPLNQVSELLLEADIDSDLDIASALCDEELLRKEW